MDGREFFRKHGTRIHTDARTPLYLYASKQVYCVTNGKANLFYFARETEPNTLVSHKSHVFTALPGDGLCGLGSGHELPGAFVCVGERHTEVYGLDPEKLREDPALLAALVDGWIAHVFSGLGTAPLPRKSLRLADSTKIAVPQEEAVHVVEGLLWIDVVEGSLSFQEDQSLLIPAKQPPFPLTGSAWLSAAENCVLRAVTTGELIRTAGLQPSLAAFHDWVLAFFSRKEQVQSELERDRLERRKGQEDARLVSSLQSLADVIKLKKPPLTPDGSSPENPLFAACRTVGKAMGIDFILPKRDPEDLSSITNASRVRMREASLSGNWWRTDLGPLLGFLETTDTPVALIPEKRTRYAMWDPITDVWQPVDAALSRLIKPFAVTFYRPFPVQKLTALDLLRFGFQGIWTSDAATVILVGLLSGMLGLLFPLATGFIFNSLIPQADRGQLLQLGLFLGLGAGAGFVFHLANSVASLRMESRMNATIQASVWDRLLNLPTPFFREFNAGDLAVRAGSINSIRRMLSSAAMSTIISGVFSVFNFIALFVYSRKLAGPATVLVIVSVALAVVSSLMSLRRYKEVYHFTGKISGLMLQLINGIAKLRVSGALSRAFHIWTGLFSRKRKAEFKARIIAGLFSVFQSIFPLVSSLVLFYYTAASPDVRLSPGNFLAFSAAFSAFTAAMLTLSATFINLLVIVPQFERAQPILKTLPESRGDKMDPGELNGDIEIDHLSFRYARSGPLVLDDVCMRVRHGEYVALVGPSGSGKSTLLRLLLGFETAGSGAIYMDGLDLTAIDLLTVRRQIGVVLQNGRIMSGTIHQNIIAASANLTIDDAWEAAEMAGLDEDIREMPMGIFTIISEGGTTISGGQRQKLLIARALVNRPRILYFDEATSALDNRTQEIVSRSLAGLNATRIIIAHRLSTIVNADTIIVLDKGRIVEHGTYGSLMAGNGAFAELAKRQII